MNSRRESLLQGDASPPGATPYALYDARDGGRSRPLSVVSGYRQTAGGRRLAWLAGSLALLGLAGLCFWLCRELLALLQGEASIADSLPARAGAALYAAPLLLFGLPVLAGIYLRPLIRSGGEEVTLRLDAKGLLDRRNRHGFIPWSAMGRMKVRPGYIEVKVAWKDLPEEARPGGLFGSLRRLRILTLPLEVSGRDLLREMRTRRRAAP